MTSRKAKLRIGVFKGGARPKAKPGRFLREANIFCNNLLTIITKSYNNLSTVIGA